MSETGGSGTGRVLGMETMLPPPAFAIWTEEQLRAITCISVTMEGEGDPYQWVLLPCAEVVTDAVDVRDTIVRLIRLAMGQRVWPPIRSVDLEDNVLWVKLIKPSVVGQICW